MKKLQGEPIDFDSWPDLQALDAAVGSFQDYTNQQGACWRVGDTRTAHL